MYVHYKTIIPKDSQKKCHHKQRAFNFNHRMTWKSSLERETRNPSTFLFLNKNGTTNGSRFWRTQVSLWNKTKRTSSITTLFFYVWRLLWKKVRGIVYTLFHYLYIVSYRLWHQLTLQILEFFKEPGSDPFKVPVFQKFVAEWEDKINKLSLVTIALQAAAQFSGMKEKKRKRLVVFLVLTLLNILYRFKRIYRVFEGNREKSGYTWNSRCSCPCINGSCTLSIEGQASWIG